MSSDLDGQGEATPAAPFDALMAAMRGLSVESSFFLQTVADRLGMAATDFSCLTLLLVEGASTAGHLAERTGLSTGAITGVLDRLERGRWARRVSDPADRRRVIVEPATDRVRDIAPVMAPMLSAARRIHAQLSPEQLDTVLRFVGDARRMLAEQTALLRPGHSQALVGESAGKDGVVTVPRNGARSGELRLAGFASRLTVLGGHLGDVLCEVDLGGAVSVIHSGEGRVSLSQRGIRRHRPGRSGAGTVTLNEELPWSIEITGGASRLSAELQGVQLTRLGVSGGASHLSIQLPVPGGSVPIRLTGGASQLTVHRPAGACVSVRVRGGASNVTIDGHHIRSVGGDTRVQGQGDPAGGCYELDISGGANQVTVDHVRSI